MNRLSLVEMRAAAALALLALVFASAAGAANKARREVVTHVLVLNLTILQHGTVRTPHAPPGDVGDVFTTTLLLSNTVPALKHGAGAGVGTMFFQYVLHGTCSTESCAGATADILATSELPGGTVVAGKKGVQLGRPPIVLPITKGTGAFKGARGTVVIGAESNPVNHYAITLP